MIKVRSTSLHDQDIMARTMWGEARGEGVDGLTAVACVVINRMAVAIKCNGYWWGSSIADICLKPFQFSTWNHNDPNYEKVIKVDDQDLIFRNCQALSKQFLESGVVDITHGATHYKTSAVSPGWAHTSDVTTVIGHQTFYRPPEVPAL